MDPDDAALVERSRGGDREAFGLLVGRHERYVRAALLAFLPEPGDAGDVARDVFLRAFRSLRDLAEPAHFRAWLSDLVQNHCQDELRRRARAHAAEDHPTVVLPDSGAEARELAERVLAEVRELPEAYRVPLLLRYVDRLGHAAITRATGVPEGAVRGLLHRGTLLLRERLAGLMDGDR